MMKRYFYYNLNKRCLLYFQVIVGLLIICAKLWRVNDFDSQVEQLLRSETLTKTEIIVLSSVYRDLQKTLQELWPEITNILLYDIPIKYIDTAKNLGVIIDSNLSLGTHIITRPWIQFTLKTNKAWEREVITIRTHGLCMYLPNAQVIPVGSISTGLTLQSSDADCMVQIPSYAVYNETVAKRVILQAARQTQTQPQLYANVRPRFRRHGKIPLLLFDYIPTGRECDVSFISDEGLRTSTLLARYYSLDVRAHRLALIMKIWNKTDPTQPFGILDSYTLNLLIIFYLQQQNILPPYYLLNKIEQNHNENWTKIPNSLSFYELLGGIFEYYSHFEYGEFVISPLMGRSVHKSEFEDFGNLPDEQVQYKTYMKQPDAKPIAMNTSLCVQDVFIQPANVAEHTKTSRVLSFISNVKTAEEKYHRLPKDSFLNGLLFNRQVSKYKKILN